MSGDSMFNIGNCIIEFRLYTMNLVGYDTKKNCINTKKNSLILCYFLINRQKKV